MEFEPEAIRDISSKSIRDKSKQDTISKCLALVQVVWFGAQCITRLEQGLPVSLLELNTFVHTLYAFITYGLWWKKPFNVDVPHTITVKSDTLLVIRRLTTKEISKPLHIRLGWDQLFCGASPFQVDDSTETISSRSSHCVIVASFFGALYGALHLAAWNSSFPTPLEGLLWCVSTLCILFCGAVVSICQTLVVQREREKGGSASSRLGAVDAGSLLLLLNSMTSYSILCSCIARVYIVVESFRSLLFLPASAYALPVWPRYIPHFD